VAASGAQSLTGHAIAGGYQYQNDTCGLPHIWPAACVTPPPANKVQDGADPIITASPFTAYGSLVCGTQGYTGDELEDRARKRLELKEQFAVEAAFWGLAAGDQPGYLQSHAVASAGIAVTNVVTALSRLEQALADCYGLIGMIHVKPKAAAYMARNCIIWKDGPLWRTFGVGNVVVFGDGYSGLGPAGEADPAAGGWMYATGMVRLWREDDILIPPWEQTLDRTANQHHILAERNWAMSVECCLISQLVTTWEGAF
jgi:hypothetical protein